jgi:four helix bundle protein
MPSHSFRNLKVWNDAMTLVEDVYRATDGFPMRERFGLATQLRRAAVSIPSNISEGARRRKRPGRRLFINHLDIALGSQGEVETQIELALRLKFITPERYRRLQRAVEEIGKMLNGLIDSLEAADPRSEV